MIVPENAEFNVADDSLLLDAITRLTICFSTPASSSGPTTLISNSLRMLGAGMSRTLQVISVTEFAKVLNVSRVALSRVVDQRAGVSAETRHSVGRSSGWLPGGVAQHVAHERRRVAAAWPALIAVARNVRAQAKSGRF